MGAEDRGLIEAARRGEGTALDELLKRSREKVLAMTRALLGNTHDAEDACQEALLAAAQGLSGLQDGARFEAWLLGIGYRKAKDLQRRRARENAALSRIEAPSMRLSEQDRTDINLTLFEQLAGLPEDQVLALNLRYHGGLSYEEIAALMGIPASTVRGAIYRGMQQLRKALKGSFESRKS